MAALDLVPVARCVHGAWLLDGPVQHEVRICVENHWSGLGCFWDPSGLGTGKPDVMKIKWFSTVGFGVLVAEDYGLGANAAQTYQNPNVKSINTQFQNSNGSRIFKRPTEQPSASSDALRFRLRTKTNPKPMATSSNSGDVTTNVSLSFPPNRTFR